MPEPSFLVYLPSIVLLKNVFLILPPSASQSYFLPTLVN